MKSSRLPNLPFKLLIGVALSALLIIIAIARHFMVDNRIPLALTSGSIIYLVNGVLGMAGFIPLYRYLQTRHTRNGKLHWSKKSRWIIVLTTLLGFCLTMLPPGPGFTGLSLVIEGWYFAAQTVDLPFITLSVSVMVLIAASGIAMMGMGGFLLNAISFKSDMLDDLDPAEYPLKKLWIPTLLALTLLLTSIAPEQIVNLMRFIFDQAWQEGMTGNYGFIYSHARFWGWMSLWVFIGGIGVLAVYRLVQLIRQLH